MDNRKQQKLKHSRLKELFNLKDILGLFISLFQVFIWLIGTFFIIDHTTGHQFWIMLAWTCFQFFAFRFFRKKMNIYSPFENW